MSGFSLNRSNKQGVEIINIKGYLDAHTAPELEEEIEKVFNAGNYKINVNFTQLDYISSAGLGVFMSHIEQIRNNNGDIKLSNMQEKVFSVFDLLGFPMLFDIVDDESEAISKFNDGSN